MKLSDILIIAGIILLLFSAVRHVIRSRGRCSCGCEGCSVQGCGKRKTN